MKNNTAPRWGTYSQAEAFTGISKRLLQDYVRLGLVRSTLVRKPGASRGIRLVDFGSLEDFIEQGVDSTSEITMNSDRKKGGGSQ